MNTSLSDKIKRTLTSGEKTAGAIKDETGATYPEIFASISQLGEAGEIEHRFSGEGADAVLCYRLKNKILLPFLTKH